MKRAAPLVAGLALISWFPSSAGADKRPPPPPESPPREEVPVRDPHELRAEQPPPAATEDESPAGPDADLDDPGVAPADLAAAPLTDDEVRRVVRAGTRALEQCYRMVERSVAGGGKAVVSFRILPAGSVADVRVAAPAFEASRLPGCVESLVRGWHFPRFRGHPMSVSYPFVFVGH